MEIKCKSVLMDVDTLVFDGRSRLVGIQIGAIGAATNRLRSRQVTQDIDNCSVILTDGSASGDELFRVGIQGGGTPNFGVGTNPMSFMLGNNRILFESGIYVNKIPDGAGTVLRLQNDRVQVSVFYEAG